MIVLETGRLFGEDSSYYYVGTYTVREGAQVAKARIVRHNWALWSVWGDAAQSLDIMLLGHEFSDGLIEATMSRVGHPAVLPVRLTFKEPLP